MPAVTSVALGIAAVAVGTTAGLAVHSALNKPDQPGVPGAPLTPDQDPEKLAAIAAKQEEERVRGNQGRASTLLSDPILGASPFGSVSNPSRKTVLGANY